MHQFTINVELNNENYAIACKYYEQGINQEQNASVIISILGFGDSFLFFDEFHQELAISTSKPVLTFDLLGFGKSDKPRIEYSMDQLKVVSESIVNQLIESFNIERVVFVGYSIGGILAMYFTTKNPNVVDNIVFISPIFFLRKISWKFRVLSTRLTSPFYRLMIGEKAASKKRTQRAYFNLILNNKLEISEEIRSNFKIIFSDPKLRYSYYKFLTNFVSLTGIKKPVYNNIIEIYEEILRIKIPIFMILSEQDKIVNFSKLHNRIMEITRDASNITSTEIQIQSVNCGHASYLEDLDQLISLIQMFVLTNVAQ